MCKFLSDKIWEFFYIYYLIKIRNFDLNDLFFLYLYIILSLREILFVICIKVSLNLCKIYFIVDRKNFRS